MVKVQLTNLVVLSTASPFTPDVLPLSSITSSTKLMRTMAKSKRFQRSLMYPIGPNAVIFKHASTVKMNVKTCTTSLGSKKCLTRNFVIFLRKLYHKLKNELFVPPNDNFNRSRKTLF